MPSNYPSGGFDTFNEPLQPESTALSQVGGQATPGRNHVEHHRDLGDAVEALQQYAARRTHDHSGSGSDPARGAKLAQANTHQNADTDSAPTAIHHTLGSGPNQAAPGDHTHDYDDGSIVNAPFLRCLSTARPDPSDGLTIYETDTNRMRVYADFGNGNGPRWNILPTANIPVVRLAQSTNQTLAASGTVISWNEEIEDNFGYFTPSANTNIVVSEPGVYHLDAALQWSVSFLPEVVTVVFYVNGQETPLRNTALQARPGLLSQLGINIGPDFSQTLAVSGKLRLAPGSVVTLRCRYGASGVGAFIQTYFDLPSRVKSRLEMNYVGP